MKKSIRKIFALVSSAAIAATMITAVPTITDAAVNDTWKFDFGTADSAVADGYKKVTPDMAYATNTVDGLQYGFLGADGHGDSYGNYIDGMDTKEGQNVTLKAAAKETVSTADDDFIGVDSEGEYTVEGDYPIRFSMKAENNHYYEVDVLLTGLDQTQPAQATLFSERRHPIITDETIAAGETKTVHFVATLQNVYIKGRDGASDITYKDDMLNVVAVGKNVAISQIVVKEVEHKPTIWMYTDSTGCDYPALQPFSPLQNYGGTGAFFTKYLPEGITIANQGDGGINAADNQHWNCANANIQAGDYIYVQYGHNHKDDGPLGYLRSIPKYYEKAAAVGAKMIFAGPIDRHNSNQYSASTNTWSSTLSGFSKAAKYYTELLVTGGKAKADEFVTKATAAGSISDEVYEWADAEIAKGVTSSGVKDVAFIDLNAPWLDWMETVSDEVKTVRGSANYESNSVDYYFRGVRGGGIDGTHPNDMGADNSANIFFNEAKKVVAAADDISKAEAEVLKPLVTGMRTATPYKVSDELIKLGPAPNTGWPNVYVPSNLPDLPAVIKDIQFNEDGSVKAAYVLTRDAKLDMSAYGIVVITIIGADGEEKGKIYGTSQVDNTLRTTQEITTFRGDTKLEDGDTYSAVVLKAKDLGADAGGFVVDDEDPETYSGIYTPTDIDTYILPGESGNVETFVYYGKTNLDGAGDWTFGGSNGHTLTLGEEGERTYATVAATGSGNSFFLRRPFKNLDGGTGTSGKYMVDVDVKYIGGSDMSWRLSEGWSSSSPFITGTGLELFQINTGGAVKVGSTEVGNLAVPNWSNVKYILDMDTGVASVSIDGSTAVNVNIPDYQTYVPAIKSMNNFVITTVGNTKAFEVQLSNMTVAKLKAETLPDVKITAASSDASMGSVYIDTAGTTEKTVQLGNSVTLVAVPVDGYELINWTDGDGNNLGVLDSLTVKAYKAGTITANFAKKAADKYDYLYHEDFKKLATDMLAGEGWKSANAQDAMTVSKDTDEALGNYLRFGANSSSRGAEKTFNDTPYTDANGVAFGISAKFNKSNGDPNEIAIHSGNIKYTDNNINYGCTDGYVLYLKQTSDGAAITLNGQATTIPDNTWFNLMAKCDFATHKATVTVKSLDGATSYFSGDVDMSDTAAVGIKGMYYKFGKNSGGVVSFDNIEIFPADQLDKPDGTPEPSDKPDGTPEPSDEPDVTPEPSGNPDNTPVPGGSTDDKIEVVDELAVNESGKATATVTNNNDAPVTVSIMSAQYDDETGVLLKVEFVTETIEPGATSENLETPGEITGGGEIKAFLWNMNGYKPIAPDPATPNSSPEA